MTPTAMPRQRAIRDTFDHVELVALLRPEAPTADLDADDRAADRRVRAARLAERAADRGVLEALRSHILHRLHRVTGDLEDVEALRTVEQALRMTPWPDGPWAWQERERARARARARWRCGNRTSRTAEFGDGRHRRPGPTR